jgi:hypothetical protein
MKENGKPVNSGESKLERYFARKISTDPAVRKRMEKNIPSWFIDTAAENKKELLELAKTGAEKPKHGSRLRMSMDGYIRAKSTCLDPEFTKQIKKLAPHWFIDTAAENKKELLKLAKSGAERPNQRKHPLGSSLSNYVSQSSDCFDPEFTKQIKKAAPSWFIDTAAENKKELLKLAKTGAERPNQRKHPLGSSLSSYIRQTHDCFDPEFVKQIKKAAPSWFK